MKGNMMRLMVFFLATIILMPITLLAAQENEPTNTRQYTNYALNFDISKKEHDHDKLKQYAKQYLKQLKASFHHMETIKPTHYEMGFRDILGFPHNVDIHITLDNSVTYDQLLSELNKMEFDTKVTLRKITTIIEEQVIHP